MNSRIAYDLMPDMTCLRNPPAIVLQFHAEEPDRAGYARYAAARYGNLVDAFSVTSHQLGAAMLDYDIAAEPDPRDPLRRRRRGGVRPRVGRAVRRPARRWAARALARPARRAEGPDAHARGAAAAASSAASA